MCIMTMHFLIKKCFYDNAYLKSYLYFKHDGYRILSIELVDTENHQYTFIIISHIN